jgi:hypothetical protein
MRRGYPALFVVSLSACASTQEVARDPGPAYPLVETVREQEILTPVPMRVSLPASLGADSVAVRFRTRGTRQWSARELYRVGQTWRGEVPCLEVSTITGDLQYYLVALDEKGHLVASSGSQNDPHTTTIYNHLSHGARSLPNAPTPWRCPDPADCPPDFPGCNAPPPLRTPCSTDNDCGDGRCEWDGYCEARR